MFTVKVECTKTDMIVSLAFGYPFSGRVYVNGNYQVITITFLKSFFFLIDVLPFLLKCEQSCFEVGNGQQQLVMRVPLVGQCGTVQQVCFRSI